MYDPARDLDILTAMAAEFDDFVKSDVIYWQMASAGPLSARHPKLTVAGLLLHRHRLRAFQHDLPPDGQLAYARLESDLAAQLASWRANLERKALREAEARLKSWGWYLNDCRNNPRACADNYAGEVHARTYLKFLFDVLADRAEASAARERLSQFDRALRGKLQAGEFVWSPELAPAFPREEFWFLWGQIAG